MSTKNVLVPEQLFSPEGIDYLKERGYKISGPIGNTKKELLESAASTDAILLRTYKVDAEVLEAAKALKIVARHGAGFDNVDIGKAAEIGVWVTNAPLATTCSVAEYAVTCMLMLAKQVPFFVKKLAQGEFYSRIACHGIELEGKTLGIAGLGRIGSEVAKKAAVGFGMKVLAFDPYCPPERAPREVHLMSKLEDLLAEADFVSLHMPGTPQTKKMFGARQFAAMKPSAYFINCARGEVVDEAALIEALKTNSIAGAAIDVFDPEPPSQDNPLLRLPNVIASPHIASNTEEASIKMSLQSAQEIHRVLSGEKPLWPVNKPVFLR